MLQRLTCLFLIFFLFDNAGVGQAVVNSSHGWTATIEITPVDAIPEFNDCPWYYHYEVQFNYSVTFSGSNSNRSVSGNLYFNCSGGTGGQPYIHLGTFTGDATGTLTTSNNARQYNASGGAYNYGANPSCTEVTVSDIGCTAVQLDYWGNGVTNGSATFATGSPLPIELTFFNAKRSGSSVVFEWETATEINNDYFTIEKSQDTKEWSAVKLLEGAGNSTQPLYYEVEQPAEKEAVYYRLRQTDFDGTTTTFKTVFVSANDQNPSPIFPNPADGFIKVSGLDNSVGSICIMNSSGQLVDKSSYSVSGDRVVTENLGEGLYFICAQSAIGSFEPFIVKH